jgi:hypothetical protein
VTNQEENSRDHFQGKIVERGEIISRFIFSDRHCHGGKVKFAAFMPPKEKSEISVYRIQGLSEDEIWKIDDQYVTGLRDRKSLGRADLSAETVLNQNLTIDPNGIPHHRHANICFSENLGKDNQRLIALKLAEASTFIPRDDRGQM